MANLQVSELAYERDISFLGVEWDSGVKPGQMTTDFRRMCERALPSIVLTDVV